MSKKKVVTIHVEGSIHSDRDIVKVIREALAKGDFRKPEDAEGLNDG